MSLPAPGQTGLYDLGGIGRKKAGGSEEQRGEKEDIKEMLRKIDKREEKRKRLLNIRNVGRIIAKPRKYRYFEPFSMFQ